MQDKLAPICLFVYKRIDETIQTIDALKTNFLAKESNLIIYSDGFKDSSEKELVINIRCYLKEITGFKSIVIRESATNKGLAQSIIYGVTEVLTSYDSIIVLEDDLITTPNFLDFMNLSLKKYKLNDTVMSINGFSLDVGDKVFHKSNDVFFHNRTYSWGWGTWKDRWSKDYFINQNISQDINNLNLDLFKKKCGEDISRMLMDCLKGKNDSWYVKWAFRHFLEDKLAVYPFLSKVRNIGYGITATHCKTIDVLKIRLDNKYLRVFNFPSEVKVNHNIVKKFLFYFTFTHKLFFRFFLVFKPRGLSLLWNDIKHKYL